MTLETVVCPSCEARLLLGEVPASQVILCAGCGTQFRPDGTWPLIRTSRKAIASFVLGLLSIIGMFVTGIPAFLVGLWALGDIRREQHTGMLKGKWLAFIGATLGGVLSLVVFVLPLFAVNYLRNLPQRRSGQRTPQAYVVPQGVITIVSPGAIWKWSHPLDGTDPATSDPDFHQTFFRPGYTDTDWQSGREADGSTGFGYGDNVAVDIGTPAEGDRKSAYFRLNFKTTETYQSLIVTCYRDDGIIVYLDGEEVGRHNMTDEPEAYDLRAASVIGGRNETAIRGIEIPRSLAPGEHVLAISLHNCSGVSSDLRLGDIKLYGLK